MHIVVRHHVTSIARCARLSHVVVYVSHQQGLLYWRHATARYVGETHDITSFILRCATVGATLRCRRRDASTAIVCARLSLVGHEQDVAAGTSPARSGLQYSVMVLSQYIRYRTNNLPENEPHHIPITSPPPSFTRINTACCSTYRLITTINRNVPQTFRRSNDVKWSALCRGPKEMQRKCE